MGRRSRRTGPSGPRHPAERLPPALDRVRHSPMVRACTRLVRQLLKAARAGLIVSAREASASDPMSSKAVTGVEASLHEPAHVIAGLPAGRRTTSQATTGALVIAVRWLQARLLDDLMVVRGRLQRHDEPIVNRAPAGMVTRDAGQCHTVPRHTCEGEVGGGTGVGDGGGVGVGGANGNAMSSRAAAKRSGPTRSWFVTTAMLNPESGR